MNSPVEISGRLPMNRSGISIPFLALVPLQVALCACGAWILRREHLRSSQAILTFEFPRDLCAEVYGALVSRGLQLSDQSHLTLTELCRCTPHLFDSPYRSLAVHDVFSLARATDYICSLEIIQAELHVRWELGKNHRPVPAALWN